MTTEEKKKELQNIIQSADEGLTNVLMEAAAEYKVGSQEDFVVPKEWIEEAEQRSKDLGSGKDKGISYDEMLKSTQQFFKEKYDVIFAPNIS